ncbi:MAG: HD domain-containing protein [Armatimonadetes bacterium]|nr:HD domain-containing protein [Armatimonadota bacterium]
MSTAPRDQQLETIIRLSFVAEFRDSDTGNHLQRVSLLAKLLAEELGLAAAEATLIAMATPMHDIGKVAIPDDILLKPGRLTPDERRVMQDHTVIGMRLLAGSEAELLKTACRITRGHHEHWDGRGYPDGIGGEDIPIEARIVALVDVYDALVTKRIYKPAASHEEAAEILRSASGSQFDPAVVDAFFRVEDRVLAIMSEYGEDDEDDGWTV